MTMRTYLRSVLFNLVYYGGTVLIGVVILPSLLLPDRLFWPFIRMYFRWVYLCEKHILNLDYTEVGRAHLPVNTPYIVAMKHQSAYETLKLPLLFPRPVVILKRELLMIPLWGWYAAKAGHIGIDRKSGRVAIDRMLDGVKRALTRGHTPVIFPQGTRVAIQDPPSEKPYKRGIYESYQAANVAVVPVAVNSGLFWPRRAFFKRPGCVTFEYLPPIPPGLDRVTFMERLQTDIETTTHKLVTMAPMVPMAATATTSVIPPAPTPLIPPGFAMARFMRFVNIALAVMAVFIFIYTAAWMYGATVLEKQIQTVWQDAPKAQVMLTEPRPRLTGFPFRYHLKWSGTILTSDVQMSVPRLDIYFWPILSSTMRIDLKNGFQISGRQMNHAGVRAVDMQSLTLDIQIPRHVPHAWIKPEVQILHDQGIIYRLYHFHAMGPVVGDFVPDFQGSATLSYDDNLQPDVHMPMVFNDADQMSKIFAGLIKHPMGKSFVTGTIGALSHVDGATGRKVLPIDLKIKDTKIYVGPFKIGSFGRLYWPVQ